jgi:hypothetical protein
MLKLFPSTLIALLLCCIGAAKAATPAPKLPSICPDLSKAGSTFNPGYWQIKLPAMAHAGMLNQNSNITQITGSFTSIIWSNYVICNYSNAEGEFNLQSKFYVQQPVLHEADLRDKAALAQAASADKPRWQNVAYLLLCTSADPRDCPFIPLKMLPATTPSPNLP